MLFVSLLAIWNIMKHSSIVDLHIPRYLDPEPKVHQTKGISPLYYSDDNCFSFIFIGIFKPLFVYMRSYSMLFSNDILRYCLANELQIAIQMINTQF